MERAEPTGIFYSILSEHKPTRPDEFTKDLKKIATRTPALDFDNGKSNGERWVSLTLKNGVSGDPADPADDAPITKQDAQHGWGKAAMYFNLTSNYVEGRITWDEAVEQATRAVLYGLDRPTADWQRHTEAVEEILESCIRQYYELHQGGSEDGQDSQEDDGTESECECGGFGCLECLKQELPFEAA